MGDKMRNLIKWLVAIVIFVLAMTLFSGEVFGFNPPDCGDPWYYQSNDKCSFWIPDKAQHYYGSYLLNCINTEYLGKWKGSIATLTLGFLWEVKDSKTALDTTNGGVIGFSYRDLIADGLGVLSSQINKRNDLKIWITYNTEKEFIMLNVCKLF